jgi:hypothetical protein
LSAAGLGAAGFGVAGEEAVGNGLAAAVLELGLDCFTFTFDVELGVGLAGGFTAFFGLATFGVAFLIVALPGRLAALLGFFEGILYFPPLNERARDYTDAKAPVQGANRNIFEFLSP